MNKLDFSGLNSILLTEVRSLLPEWLPGGRVMGQEYCCGDLYGGPGNSMRVNITTGKWADFAASVSGGDLVSLFAAINKIGNGDAFKRLNDMYGGGVKASFAKKPSSAEAQVKLIPPPKGISLPAFKSKPSAIYRYKDETSSVLFLISRHDYKDKKVFAPWSWCTTGKWVKKAWPSPRPLYNLDRIHKFPNKPILICEGEKAADAAHEFCGVTYNVTTWSNGSNACNKADWSPIYGKENILIWPDADDPGRKCANKIAELLKPHCNTIKIIDTSGFNGGRDAADFGFKKMDEFVSWAKPLARVVGDQNPEPHQPPESEQPPMPEEPPHTTVINNNLTLGDADDIPAKPKSSELVMWEKMGLRCNGTTKIPHNNASNIKKILKRDPYLKNKIWYDEFHFKMFTTINWYGENDVPVRPWVEADEVELMTYVQDDLGMHRCNKQMCKDAIKALATRSIRNEPREWMDSLEWDGTSRVSSFFIECMGSNDSDYSRAISQNFWISMIARVYTPGCKVDNMVILEGKQGARKSSALEILGRDWYVTNSQDVNKNDFKMVLRGRLLVELDELDALSKAEANKIKSVLSTATDAFRAPYAADVADHPRSCIFVGTTNETNYLKDPTGGRRFWPLKITDINLDAIKAQRDQLFAEAVSLYKDGKTWYEVPDSAAEEQERRRDADAWEDVIYNHLSKTQAAYTTVTDICEGALNMDVEKITPMVSNRVGRILRAIGWIRGKKRVPGSSRSISAFFPPESSSVQIKSKSSDKVLNNILSDLPNHAPN